MKKCWICKQVKPHSDFYKRRSSHDGLCDQCKPCGKARAADWRAKNLERSRAINAASARRRRRGERATRPSSTAKYRMEPGDYERMKAEQAGRCALCGTVPKHRLAVDHDHETGRVRALLCYACNSGIGYLQENPEVLRRAAAYIEAHKPDGIMALAIDLAATEP